MRLVVCIPSPPSAPPVHSAVKCHTHRLQVFGQCDFDVDALTSDFDVRNGLKEDDFDEHYMVLGLFGDHQNDDMDYYLGRVGFRGASWTSFARRPTSRCSRSGSAGALPGKRPGNSVRSRLSAETG